LTNDAKPWFTNWPVDVPKTLNQTSLPVHGLLQETAKKYPQNTAIIYGGRQISYGELDLLSNQFANALVELDVRKGDRAAVFLPNAPQFLIAYFGILKAGAIVTTVSPFNREREVEHQLCDSGTETVVALDSLYPIVQKALGKCKVKNTIITGLNEFGGENASVQAVKGTSAFKQVLEDSPKTPLKIMINTSEDLAALQYTGGTTGTAKGAMLTHRNLVSDALAFAAWIKGVQAEETFLTALPLFHIYGMTTSMTVPVSLGAKMVLIPRFEPAAALEIIEQQKVTVFCGVPTMYSALLSEPELSKHDLTSVRVCISGSSPLPPQVQKDFMQVTGGFLAEGFGLTEASPVTHCTPVDKTMRTVKIGSIGLPLPDTEARIVDIKSGTKTLGPDEVGELAVKGPQVMKGYWKKPKETALVIRDGWLLTGDIARMDQDGYFFILDRKKDLIKYKGFSVYPRELEDILYEHPAVKLCVVIGKPDHAAGEIPKAFVVLKDGVAASAEELMAFVNDKVAPYKAIRAVEFRKDLPASSVGKVLRRLLH
jgi:long-chain acyl-CoA synthetase